MQAWLPTVLGLVAGCCSTAAFVPQVLKIWREGDTRAMGRRVGGGACQGDTGRPAP